MVGARKPGWEVPVNARTIVITAFTALALTGCGSKISAHNALPDSEAVRQADLHWAQGRLELAQKELHDALEHDSKSFPARYREGAHEVEDHPRDAITDLTEASALAPDHPGPPAFLGFAHQRLSDFAGAQADMEQALELERARVGYAVRDTTAEVREGIHALEEERFLDAMIAFRSDLDRDSTRAAVWYLYGRAAFLARDLDKAGRAAEKARSLRSDFPEARSLRAAVYLENGDPAPAKAEIEAALALDPGLADAHYRYGLYHLQESEYREGLLELWQAVLENPLDPVYQEETGRTLMKVGLPQQASAFYQHAEAARTFLDRHFHRGTFRKP